MSEKELNNSILEVQSISLAELLNTNKLAIPEYQRPYVWSEIDIRKFLNQFKLHFDRIDENLKKNENKISIPNYYLGSIVLHKSEFGKLNIIDGQQRITTLLLISNLEEGNSQNKLEYHHPLTFKNIKNNLEILKKLNEKDNFKTIINRINFSDLNITTIITTSEDLAYNFFETLNTGGVKLSGTDILKAHHLRVLKNEMKPFAIEWENNQKHLEDVNRILLIARKLNIFENNEYPNKFAKDSTWKTSLTQEFSEKTSKNGRDIGYTNVIIEKNTHTVTSDKYAIRQPLNDGENYINYLLSFARDYEAAFLQENKGCYSSFNNEIINVIDGTYDLRFYYKIALMCFVDRFGKDNLEEFSLWLFRNVYSVRFYDQTRIYEVTVKNMFIQSKLLERIMHAFTYEEILEYLKNEPFTIPQSITGVKWRFYDRINKFFNIDNKDYYLKNYPEFLNSLNLENV